MSSLKNQNFDRRRLLEEFNAMITKLDDPARVAEFNDPANFTKIKIAIMVSNLKDQAMFSALKKIISITESNNSNNISLLKEFLRISELSSLDRISELEEYLRNSDLNDPIIITVVHEAIRRHELSERLRVAVESGEIKTIEPGSIFIEKEFMEDGKSGIANYIRRCIENSEGKCTKFNSEEMAYIADVLEGKIKKTKGRPANIKRDRKIAWMIDLYLKKEMKLTSNSNEDGAAALVATKFGIDEDAAIKAYQRMKPEIDAQYEEWKWNGYD
ncbi:MAG: hypothetical protein KGZ58_06025 [Ignavibacteriales bacterium]|nr:hypothetical protein [Ignavibacteriales bacterium]